MSQDTMENTPRNGYANIVADKDLSPAQAIATILRQYTRERPEVVALWSFGIGFVLGWKLKPW